MKNIFLKKVLSSMLLIAIFSSILTPLEINVNAENFSEESTEENVIFVPADERGKTNYAQGAEYGYDGEHYFYDKYSDNDSTLLTDGVVSYEDVAGLTVMFEGTARVVSLIIDLGEVYSDIETIKFCAVGNGEHRDFSYEKTIVFFSEDEINYTRNRNFDMITEEVEGEYCNVSFKFNSLVKGRYVKIAMYSYNYLFSLSEIKILSAIDYYFGESENQIEEGKTVADFKEEFSGETVFIKVKDFSGKKMSDEAIVGTGCTIETFEKHTYTAVVKGDLDGSGEIDVTDYLIIRSAFLGELTLNGAYFLAADFDKSEEIDATDYVCIKNFFLNK